MIARIVFLIAVVSVNLFCLAEEVAPSQDTKLEGRWNVVSVTANGELLDDTKEEVWTIQENRLTATLFNGEVSGEATLVVDVKKSPRHIDIELLDKKRRALAICKGVYSLAGDRLMVSIPDTLLDFTLELPGDCIPSPLEGTKRRATFSQKQDILFVLKRSEKTD